MADNIITNVVAYHLADNKTLYEPARSNTFRFIVSEESFKNLKYPAEIGGKTETNLDAKKSSEYLEFSVVSMTIPTFQLSTIEIRRGNSVMKAAGIPTFNDGQLVINDFIGADGKSILLAWQALAYNVATEKIGLMSDYKKDCQLLEYTPDYKLVRTWNLYGCWVSNVSQDALSKEGDNKRTITATIVFDKADMVVED